MLTRTRGSGLRHDPLVPATLQSVDEHSETVRASRRVQFSEVFHPIPVGNRAQRYVQVIEQIESAIRRGLLVPGDTLPTESQFCEGFGVARSTLRRAMDDLEERGIVARTQGSGTRIARALAIEYRPETSNTIFQAIARSHRQPRTVVTEFEPVITDDAIAVMTGFAVGTPLLRIIRERYANDTPIAGLETYLLPEALCFTREDLETKSLDAILHENGWTMDRVEYDIRACGLEPALTEFMQVDAGTPVLQEFRRGFHGTRLFSSGCNTYHPTNHRLHGVVDRGATTSFAE